MAGYFVVLVGLLFPFCGLAKELKKPNKSSTFETLEHDVSAIAVGNKRIFYLPSNGANAYDVTYSSKKDAFQFGGLMETRRSNLKKQDYKEASWSGAEYVDENLILIDGFRLGIVILDKDLLFKRKSDVVYDLVKPPADRLEAPQFEIEKLRKKFDLEMKTAPGNRLRGLSLKSIDEKKVEFFVGMSLKSFPLGILECAKNSLHKCKITRVCNFDGFRGIDPRNRRGVAYDKDSGKLYMANQKTNKIIVAKFNACNDIRILESIQLTGKMKQVKSIAYGKKHLWVGLKTKDDYYNTSIFTYSLN